jgi:hypothetical protein
MRTDSSRSACGIFPVHSSITALKTSHCPKLIQPKAPIPVNKALVAALGQIADQCH